ncbi:P-loop containing nucleoside triphosphate hydrolase protein [Acrodontium crateriforme]|uniref:P-loop containing nucleoside triphosphate hydrolase protein n=1 Tax=Acrodontium crateriforme TaxID=150365 RepID=A0AAQ3RCY9_9PEZI|nr:P-loop containing nucleoside triphosphate hydrolase protein [Acrodontium crateriforme]
MLQELSPGQISPNALCLHLKPLLTHTEEDPRPVALMVCGVSGSGKSTSSQAVVRNYPSFERVSFDGIVASRHGIAGVDFDHSQLEEFAEEADFIFEKTVPQVLAAGKDVVLDRAFYAKADRDNYRRIVEECGGRVVLVYFNIPKEVLLRRIRERRDGYLNADNAREISDDLLGQFIDGFDVPDEEGEIVINYETSLPSS